MYCKYCGQKIDDDSTFCSGCGAKISIAVSNNKQPNIRYVKEKNTKAKTAKKDDFDEDFEPTFGNIMAQFSPIGKVVFIVLCILMVIWVASLTVYIFYPQFTDYLSTL